MPETTGGRQLLGQPWWIWGAGGLALIGGYVYLRRKATAAAAQQQTPAAGTGTTTGGTSPTGLSWEQFLLFLHDQQGTPAASTPAAGSTGGGGTPGTARTGTARPSAQPPLMSGSYTVKAGESLQQIADRYHISRAELAHANGLGTGAGLKTGQKLKVPGPLVTRAQGGPG